MNRSRRDPARALPRLARAPRALALTLLTTLAACSHKAPPPAEAPPLAAADPEPGTAVTVRRGAQVAPAHVVRNVAPGRVLVHYDGFGNEWDEAITTDRIIATRPEPEWKAGETVLVTSQNRDLLATIVDKASPKLWRVHYDGYGAQVVEAVPAERLHRPYSGPAARHPGEIVGVDAGGRVMTGRVLAVTKPDRYLVRFDEYGPTLDQEIPTDRLRPPPPPPVVAPAAAAPPETAGDAKRKDDAKAGKSAGAAKGAAAASAPPGVVLPTGPLQAGEAVFVAQRGGTYALGTLTSPAGPGWRVHFESTGAPADDDVAADRVERANAPLKGVKYPANQRVFIEWHGVYVPGKVLKDAGTGQYKVRYDGYGPESDEVLTTKRLRPRP